MGSNPTFLDDFCGWIQSLNLSVVHLPSPIPFPLLQINCDSNSKLVVLLVELSTWNRIDSQDSINFETIASSFRNKGIAFVNLWEDTWLANRKIVESRIKAMLGYSNRIPGRVTKVRRITKNEAAAFLHENHLQDPLAAKYRFGLFLPDNYFRLVPFLQTEGKNELLLAVATFSPPKIFKKNDSEHRSYELVRFANLLGTVVVGGLDKLLKAFEQDRQPDDIMTYADLDWSEGKSYLRLGFEEISDTKPHYFRLYRTSLTRSVLTDFSTIKDLKNDSEAILIKNSGSRKFVRKRVESSK